MHTPADPPVEPSKFTEPGVYWLEGGCIEVIEGANVPSGAAMRTPQEVDAFFEAFWSHQGA